MIPSTLHFWLDTHVHVYNHVSIDTLLDTALENLQSHQSHQESSLSNQHYPCLFLTQSAKERSFLETIRHSLANQEEQRWQFEINNSHVLATKKEANRTDSILLMLGQQLVSSEGIEVLTLSENPFSFSPKPIKEILINNQTGISILPWGFGKWLAKRGKIIQSLCEDTHLKTLFFLGDIPAKTPLLGGTKIFQQHPMHLVLRGSDPLPIKNDASRIGRFVSHIRLEKNNRSHSLISSENIAKTLLLGLKQASYQDIHQLGTYHSMRHNLYSQIRIRL